MIRLTIVSYILYFDYIYYLIILSLKERCRLTIENRPPRVSSMGHFFLERGPNPKNFCCLGQSSISKGGPSKNKNCKIFKKSYLFIELR
jgi:hypothetical protein